MRLRFREAVGTARQVWARVRPSRGDLILLVGAAVMLVLVTSDVLAGGLLTYLDDAIRDATMPSGEAPEWTRTVGVLGNVGVGGAAVVVTALVAMHVSLRWWPGVLAAGQLSVTGLVVVLLKYVVARPGPGSDESSAGYPGYYPSGHTATAAVSVGIVVFLLSILAHRPVARARRCGLVAGTGAGLLVAASTVLGGFHWVTDALASLVSAAVALSVGFGMAESHLAGAERRTTLDPR